METAETSARYRTFARAEARGRSPLYEQLAAGVAEDPELLGLLCRLPPPNRQANLLFATVRFLGRNRTCGLPLRSPPGTVKPLVRGQTAAVRKADRQGRSVSGKIGR